MQIKNTTGFAYGYASTSRRPPQPEAVLVVRGKFVIQPGAAVTTPSGVAVIEQGPIQGDVFASDDAERAGECLYPSDLAHFKLRAEVMLKGTCHAPGGQPTPMCPIRFAVGGWSKILRVVGPRVFRGSSPTKPLPFGAMPIDYAHAYGGPGFAPNPVGKGYGTEELPNIEGAREPVESRSDRPEPAGFGPLSPFWPTRRKKLGKAKSKKGRAFHGDDFDWSYFQSAPADQQIEGYLRGDEELTFQNLHPAVPILTTRLPGLRVRAFVKDLTLRFREVRMNLDTLFADLDAGLVYLTWRGLDAVEELDLADVATVLFASEKLGDPALEVDHYRGVLEAFEKNPRRLDEVLSEADLAAVERAERMSKEHGQAGGAPALGGDPLPPFVEEKLKGLDPRARAALAPRLASILQVGKRNGVDLGSAICNAIDGARRPSGGGPASALAALQRRIKGLRAQAVGAGQSTKPFDDFDAAMKNPKLAEAGVKPPSGDGKEAPASGPGADMSGQDLTGKKLDGLDLRGANLDRAILTGASLKGAKLEGASLKNAVLSNADLTSADLTGANLTEALMTGARAAGAKLDGCDLTRAILHAADLTGASLVGAHGDATVFSQANLTNASCARVRFYKPVVNEATLESADFSGAELRDGVFAKCRGKGLGLGDATIDRMSFFGSDLTGASLVGVRGDKTTWVGCDLTGANFSLAALPSALFTEAKASKAKFYGANLKRSQFYKAVLDLTDFVRANLFGANLTLASIQQACFVEANLYDAKLVMVRGQGYDLAGANLKRAIVEAADAR